MEFILSFIFAMAILWGVMSVLSLFRGISRVFIRPNQQQKDSPFARNNSYMYNNPSKSPKIFDRNEGKYVGYEELKD